MTYIPDTRNDDTYNQKYLNEKDKAFIRGYDYCAKEVVDHFFDDLDFESDYLKNLLNTSLPEEMKCKYQVAFGVEAEGTEVREMKSYGDYLRYHLFNAIEMERDELITSMIDNMDDDEYEAIKAEIDEE